MEERTAAMFSGKPCNGRVLIMDDEPDVRKVVRIHLEKAGYEVMEAEDGEQAIAEIIPYSWTRLFVTFEHPKLMGLEPFSISKRNIQGSLSL